MSSASNEPGEIREGRRGADQASEVLRRARLFHKLQLLGHVCVGCNVGFVGSEWGYPWAVCPVDALLTALDT